MQYVLDPVAVVHRECSNSRRFLTLCTRVTLIASRRGFPLHPFQCWRELQEGKEAVERE
jgi:hypothetical protein